MARTVSSWIQTRHETLDLSFDANGVDGPPHIVFNLDCGASFS
jgi:hypothetical protein